METDGGRYGMAPILFAPLVLAAWCLRFMDRYNMGSFEGIWRAVCVSWGYPLSISGTG